MAVTALRIQNDSIVIKALVNGKPCEFVLDTGDAIGPTFNSADAQRLGLAEGPSEGVSGAGGASSVYATTATIALGADVYASEPGAVDPDLQGPSLLGLPFFLDKADVLILAWRTGELMLI
jgi:predicted aspartyl protease